MNLESVQLYKYLIYINFNSIQVFDSMSRDRQILYLLIIGINDGDISKVARKTIGKAHQARWITLAARILRLYCSVPTKLGAYMLEVLERLATFIIKVYFKVRSWKCSKNYRCCKKLIGSLAYRTKQTRNFEGPIFSRT